jgi:hypothetical protein
MSFCDHCQGQRFDRARVLRALRDSRRRLRQSSSSRAAESTLALAIEAVRRLDIPHLEPDDEVMEGEAIH